MENEKRLIDANALKSEFEWLKSVVNESSKGEVMDVMQRIDNAPTVDAVEVVRCKECRWSREKDHREPTETPKCLICQCFMNHHIPAPWGARLAVDPEHLCSYGERRSENAAH